MNTPVDEAYVDIRAASKQDMLELIREALSEILIVTPLSQEEIQWVRIAIKADAQRAQLRKAVIEKSLAGLVWSGLVATGVYAANYVQTHWKP